MAVAETTVAASQLSNYPVTPAVRKDGVTVKLDNIKLSKLNVTTKLTIPTPDGNTNTDAVNVGYLKTYTDNKVSTVQSALQKSIDSLSSKESSLESTVNTNNTNITTQLNSINSTLTTMNSTLNTVKNKVDGLVDGNNTAY